MRLRFVLFWLMFLLGFLAQGGESQRKVFNVMKYGAIPDGKTDNTKAFLMAWSEACEWQGGAKVLVPQGKYILVGPIEFEGPCKGLMALYIEGVLMATNDHMKFSDKWITFGYIDGLIVSGGGRGTIDGQGQAAWHLNDCNKNPNCKPLPISMRFNFVKNSMVHHLKSIDSKNSHFMLFGCENMNLTHIRITAPRESPNTDGIHIGISKNINISHLAIGTGDDCISLGPGSRNIHISDVSCGPGHGISIGSLGKYRDEENVTEVFVNNCTLRNTTSGVRIKTWGSSFASKASILRFEDVFMENVWNPIIIDQQYCPYPHCNDQKSPSKVQISDVTYKNIRGTSNSDVAVTLNCSKSIPCQKIVMQDINLAQNGLTKPPSAFCFNAKGESYGKQIPPSCL